MEMNKRTSKRIGPGVYETHDGFLITRCAPECCGKEWILTNPDGGYMDHYATKGDALDGIDY
jgi:hypothetical protein